MINKKESNIKTRLIFFIACFAMPFSGYALQPVISIAGGMTTPIGQQSQTLTFANTVFNYQPQRDIAFKPLMGAFIGVEYPITEIWSWQFGLSYYQAISSSINGEEAQAPTVSLDAVNIWNYHYKILSRQFLIETKLFFNIETIYHPYLIVGLGEGFNHSYDFEVRAQNSGEVATAIFDDNVNKVFTGTIGFGLDIAFLEKMRLGAGYRFTYLGNYDLGKGILNTGAGGSIFFLPALKSKHSYNHEILFQLTYLI